MWFELYAVRRKARFVERNGSKAAAHSKSNRHPQIHSRPRPNRSRKKENNGLLHKSVKFFYIRPKGIQYAASKQMKENCEKILAEVMSSQPTEPLDDHAQHKVHPTDSVDVDVDVDAAGPSKRQRASNVSKKTTKSTNEGKIFMGIFYKKVMKNEMPLQVLMQHKRKLPDYLKSWYQKRLKLHKKNNQTGHLTMNIFNYQAMLASLQSKPISTLRTQLKF